MANMFSDKVKKKVPKTLQECYTTDSTSQNLWIWCEKLEGWGNFLFWFIIISGLIVTITSSITVRDIVKGTYYTYTDRETYFSFGVFITSLISTIIYAFIEYCIYHILALLISSLATIVQDTRITANIALYNAAKEEGFTSEETEKTTSVNNEKGYSLSKLADERESVNNDGFWICKECGTKNDPSKMHCKDCGKYK